MKLSILSLNAHKFFSPFRFKNTLLALKDLLHTTGADIVLIQELKYSTKSPYPNLTNDDPLEHLADQMWPFYAYGKNSLYSGGHHGNAILSKYPIKKWKNIDISNYFLEQRGLLISTIEIPNITDITVACTHLDLTEMGRQKQVVQIFSQLESHLKDKKPVILGGDFNDWTRKSELYFQSRGFQSADLEPSFPSYYPMLNLDKIFLNHSQFTSTKTLNSPLWKSISDHLPIYSEIEF